MVSDAFSWNSAFCRHQVCDGTGRRIWKSIWGDHLCNVFCLSDDCNVYFPLYCTISRDNEADFQKCSVDRYRQFSVHITSFWSQYFSTVCDVFQCTGNDHSTCILVHDWIFVSGICHIVYLPEDLFEI